MRQKKIPSPPKIHAEVKELVTRASKSSKLSKQPHTNKFQNRRAV